MDNEIAVLEDSTIMTDKSEPIKITGLGARLKAAREAMHLTEKEAAARLYLNVKIIGCIENESFENGPPLTFMRGYLRSYARLLSFSESDIKVALDNIEIALPPTRPNVPILHASPINRNERYIRWITYLVVLTLIVLVSLWWNSHSRYVITDVPTKPSFQAAPPIAITHVPPISTENAGSPSAIEPITSPAPAAISTDPVKPSTTNAPKEIKTVAPSNAPITAAPTLTKSSTKTTTSAVITTLPSADQPSPQVVQKKSARQKKTVAETTTAKRTKSKTQPETPAISHMALSLPEPE